MTVATKDSVQIVSAEASQAELAQLVKSAGGVVIGQLIQRLDSPTKALYLGKGKLDEIIALKDELHFDTVVFDDELSPVQQRNLEEALQVWKDLAAVSVPGVRANHNWRPTAD